MDWIPSHIITQRMRREMVLKMLVCSPLDPADNLKEPHCNHLLGKCQIKCLDLFGSFIPLPFLFVVGVVCLCKGLTLNCKCQSQSCFHLPMKAYRTA